VIKNPRVVRDARSGSDLSTQLMKHGDNFGVCSYLGQRLQIFLDVLPVQSAALADDNRLRTERSRLACVVNAHKPGLLINQP